MAVRSGRRRVGGTATAPAVPSVEVEVSPDDPGSPSGGVDDGAADGGGDAQHELDAPPWRRFESTLMATSRQIRRAYDDRLERVDLNLSEACLLAYVVEHGPLTQTQVAERIGMGRAPAGTIVDNLSKRGLLVRAPDPADRRVWMLSGTRAGLKLAAQVADVEAELRVELRQGLGREERQQLAATLLRLQENLARVLDS
ncbi:MarR family winged helix-turn-helix transcriptional regulator [Pseudonocardia sp. GCM10023141]|uniref:MarR family winged helix-turn-helix transcriptional regulator n=1 Tax=Pseudonocardia sp. GCM10023141 TaxID=3252653 RepID=UPI003617E8F4